LCLFIIKKKIFNFTEAIASMDCLCRQVNTIDQFQAGLGSITLPVPGADPGFQVRAQPLTEY
jgi:hypothetical protein